jgi:predicted ATP-grasp superfamily ATP-dependent carboligase
MPDVKPASAANPPALIVGGDANAVSVARALNRHGIEVHALNHPDTFIRHSRAARWIVLAGDTGPLGWERFLLGADSDFLRGAVLLVCSDEAIDIVIRNYAALSSKFRLEPSRPEVKRTLLDKFETYRLAQEAGVPTPRFWRFDTVADLERQAASLPYPAIVKPLVSQDFAVYGRKYLLARNREELVERFREVALRNIPVVVMEYIHGGDDRLCSYNAWMDERGAPLLSFTKRIIRRHPANMGIACCHVTDWNTKVAELGLKLFRHVGLVGFGNVEFKRDARDGLLKIIECNARFTASDCLATASGVPFALFTYQWLAGQAPKPSRTYRTGRRLWLPIEDFHAFRALRREGKLGFGAWLLSIRPPTMLPLFDWRDPGPSLHALVRRFGGATRKGAGRVRAGLSAGGDRAR